MARWAQGTARTHSVYNDRLPITSREIIGFGWVTAAAVTIISCFRKRARPLRFPVSRPARLLTQDFPQAERGPSSPCAVPIIVATMPPTNVFTTAG